MNKDNLMKGLTIASGPIGWTITGLLYAEKFRQQYCEIRRRRKTPHSKLFANFFPNLLRLPFLYATIKDNPLIICRKVNKESCRKICDNSL